MENVGFGFIYPFRTSSSGGGYYCLIELSLLTPTKDYRYPFYYLSVVFLGFGFVLVWSR